MHHSVPVRLGASKPALQASSASRTRRDSERRRQRECLNALRWCHVEGKVATRRTLTGRLAVDVDPQNRQILYLLRVLSSDVHSGTSVRNAVSGMSLPFKPVQVAMSKPSSVAVVRGCHAASHEATSKSYSYAVRDLKGC